MEKLYLIMLGGRPPARNIEQHDIAFAVGESFESVKHLVSQSWRYASHVDSYATINEVDGYQVLITNTQPPDSEMKLFFINLGGYKENDFEEYHKKLVIAARSMDEAKKIAKKDSFFLQGYTNDSAQTHIDDKRVLDDGGIDEVILIQDKLPNTVYISLTANESCRFENNKIFPCYIPI